MTAGHDTSATTVAWRMKFLADHPAPQARLRAELRKSLPGAAREKRPPTYQKLAAATTHTPYLDAVVEEVLRHANTIAFVVRRAQQDTTVPRRQIPKETDVFFMKNGAGYLKPSIPIKDEQRSPRSRRAATRVLTGTWYNADISLFLPARWLAQPLRSGWAPARTLGEGWQCKHSRSTSLRSSGTSVC